MRAGEVQMAHFGRDLRVDKKGAIDLVTEIDIEIERGFRAMIAERFPDHAVLGEEFGAGDPPDATPSHLLGVRSDRRHDQLRARPADLLFVAGASKSTASRSSPPSTIRRGGAVHGGARPGRAGSTARRCASPRPTHSSTRCSSPGSITTCRRIRANVIELFAAFISRHAPSVGSARPRSTSATSRPGASTGSGSASCSRGTSPPAR